MRDNKWLHYECLDAIRESIYKNLLTEEHLIPYKIEIKKMTFPGGESDEDYNFRGWEFRKNNKRYLVSDCIGGKQIDIKDILPILPKKELELGSKGLVFSHIRKPISMRFKREQHYSFHDFVDTLCGLSHSNPDHYKMATFRALASVYFRYNDRVATNPGFGKDSIVEIQNSLIGKCGTIESPTLAKVEERASVLRWLVINEVVDIGATEWRTIQQFLLAAGAHKPSITKHSRAHGGVGEVIDLTNLSISLFFNDITDYDDPKKYFDFVTKGAAKDRFPYMRLHGFFTEDFNKLIQGDIKEYANSIVDEFKELIYTHEYYRYNIDKHIHNYNTDVLRKIGGRTQTNVGRLLKVIDAYCDTQEEFNHYLDVLNKAIKDYEDMLHYPETLLAFYDTINIPKDIYETFYSITAGARYLYESYFKDEEWVDENREHQYNYILNILNTHTFTEKVNLMRAYKDKNKMLIEDKKDLWS